MKISELPPEIKEKALEYQRNASSLFDKDTDDLELAFSWDDTEESGYYWLSWDEKKPEIKTTDLKEAKKESQGKLYYELDFKFISQMAERMQANKENSKYELWNWKKPMNEQGFDKLKQALLRHILSVMDNDFEDDGREFGHLEAIANNAMMINYQLKKEI